MVFLYDNLDCIKIQTAIHGLVYGFIQSLPRHLLKVRSTQNMGETDNTSSAQFRHNCANIEDVNKVGKYKQNDAGTAVKP